MVGLLGGAFDPPHNGHLALAREAIQRFELDRLLVVVMGRAPHKTVETDAEKRFQLAEAAFAGMPRIELSRHELDRESPSYTVETARWAAEMFGDPIFLVGADEFADFLAWKDPDAILDYLRFGVATRPGFRREQLLSVLESLSRPDRVEFFEIPSIPISSTEIRERAQRGERIDELVPEPVAELIDELGLYR